MMAIYRPSLFGRDIVNDWFTSLETQWDYALKSTTAGYPVVDMFTDDAGSTILEFALAGFSKDEIKIEAKPETKSVTVSYESSVAKDPNRRIARRSFSKTYVNPDNSLDFTKITAKFENGLLTVTIPKRPEEKTLTINIS